MQSSPFNLDYFCGAGVRAMELTSLVPLQVLASHDEPIDDKVCPEAKASLFSAITFSWLTPILRKGYRYRNLSTAS